MNRSVLPLACFAAACGTSTAAPAPAGVAPATPVRLAPVERGPFAQPVRATATLARKAEVRASFKVGGVVATIAVDEGAVVRKGQVLARLASTEVAAGVEQARQGVAKAERDLARAQRLLADRAATGAQVDDATTGVEIARAQLRAAQFNATHAVIRAPEDGRVLRRLVEAGEVVAPGQPILLLGGDADGWIARASLADRELVRLAPGDRARLRFAAFPGLDVDATVAELATAATPPSGTYEVELQLAAPPAGLMSGLVADATITPRPGAERARVPAAALRDGDGARATVWVPSAQGQAEARAVAVAWFDGAHVVLADALPGVTAIVTDGAAYLTAGAPLEVVP